MLQPVAACFFYCKKCNDNKICKGNIGEFFIFSKQMNLPSTFIFEREKIK